MAMHTAKPLLHRVLMDNFTPEQYDRYEAYRRNALPKQAVRKVVSFSIFPIQYTDMQDR
jgi:hypothetical protein